MEIDGEELTYRPLRWEESSAVEKLHQCCFPVRYSSARFYEPLLRGRPVDGANASFAMGVWTTARTGAAEDGQNAVLHVDAASGAVQELVGCITYSMHPNPDASGQYLVEYSDEVCYIMTLGVAPRFRRRGLASDMLRRTILHAETRGAGLIHLHVIVTNPVALGFYQRHGFQQLGVVKDYYHFDSTHYDAQRLGRFLLGDRAPLSFLETWLQCVAAAAAANCHVPWTGVRCDGVGRGRSRARCINLPPLSAGLRSGGGHCVAAPRVGLGPARRSVRASWHTQEQWRAAQSLFTQLLRGL